MRPYGQLSKKYKFNLRQHHTNHLKSNQQGKTNAVLFNGDLFKITVGMRHGRTLFNIFKKGFMSDALEDHKGCVSIGGRNFISFRLANDIVVNAAEEEANRIATSMDTIYISNKISPDKTKKSNPGRFKREIK